MLEMPENRAFRRVLRDLPPENFLLISRRLDFPEIDFLEPDLSYDCAYSFFAQIKIGQLFVTNLLSDRHFDLRNRFV